MTDVKKPAVTPPAAKVDNHKKLGLCREIWGEKCDCVMAELGKPGVTLVGVRTDPANKKVRRTIHLIGRMKIPASVYASAAGSLGAFLAQERQMREGGKQFDGLVQVIPGDFSS